MPKESLGPRQFRKGTKSCVECRHRKLKCDGQTPCQNCRSHGRTCVLQTEMARASVGGGGESLKATSRDRIERLEEEVGSLWAVVGELGARVGGETPYRETKAAFTGTRFAADTDADSIDSQEDTPGNAPSHLQALFDGSSVFDLQHPTTVSPHMDMGEVVSPAALQAATKKLQCLMPSKGDVTVLAEYSSVWISLYEGLFATAGMYKSSQEMLAKYESVQGPDAHPCAVAVCLLAIAITAQQTPASVAPHLQGIDLQVFPREVSALVEEIVVSDNALGGTMEGIETSLLFLRLQLVRARIKKVWLLLRRCIALAELIGLPRAASSIRSSDPAAVTPRQRAAAQLWSSICVTDRMSGMMMNLPCGTAAYPFPKPERIFDDEGKLVPSALFAALAGIAQQVLEIDDLHISGADEVIIFQKVLSTDAELRAISNAAPEEWWSMPTTNLVPVDHVLKYWHSYFTVRTHLATAMKSNSSDQFAYSRSRTTEASRALGFRYTQLRDKLPPGFFAGRILDLQVLTAMVFLLHSVYSYGDPQQSNFSPENAEDLALVRRVTEQMETTGKTLSGDISRQGSKALKAMLEHFANPQAMGSKTLTLRIPMLGKVHINRKPVRQPAATPGIPLSNHAQMQSQPQTNGVSDALGYFAPQDSNGQYDMGSADVDMANSMGWSMDLMGDFPFMADDDPYASGDSWLWFQDWTTPPQPQ